MTIALVTMVFLPATFTSGGRSLSWVLTSVLTAMKAIFSTSFFNFTPATESDSEQWRVSSKFWVFWVVAAVLTALTLLTWAMIGRMRARTGDKVY